MNKPPRVLWVETGYGPFEDQNASSVDRLDYHVYANIPPWWRKIEQMLRLDIYLALRAKQCEDRYDIIWAGSEKVGIPLSFMRLHKPLVVVAHHMESAMKARLAQTTGIVHKWAGIGYISNESKDFLNSYYGVPIERLFQYESAKLLDKISPTKMIADGPIMSLGIAKRDYPTLIEALRDLEGYETQLFISSKFGDQLTRRIRSDIPPWVHLMGYVSDDEVMRSYQQARFIVVPLEATTQNSAGINVVLEAAAFGKAVIASHVGGMPSFVKDGETGILVPPYDIEALRSAIQKLWNDPHLAYQMGLAGRQHIETHFNPVTVNSNINTLLNRVYLNSQK